MVTMLGLTLTEKSKPGGGCALSTFTVTDATLVAVPATPARLTVYVPGGVWVVVSILRVDVKSGIPLVLESVALIPGTGGMVYVSVTS